MSQSPVSRTADLADDHRYLLGLDALSYLMARGRSFSGWERNCAYLNVGAGKFANVSTVLNLDFLDDGRGAATVDWNHDGRLDLWVSNRTAPVARFLHNTHKTYNGFLALRLEGTRCNRDAIGARVELHLKSSARPLQLKTLRAGDAFLTQSTKWLHFGLGTDAEIRKVVVRWPGGEPEEFVGLEPNGFYFLRQDDGRAKRWSPPRSGPLHLVASEPKLPNSSARAQIFLAQRVSFPSLSYRKLNGVTKQVDSTSGRPLLIILWSTACPPCLRDLAEFGEFKDDLGDANLELLALNVDSLAAYNRTVADAAAEKLNQLNVAGTAALATDETLDALEQFQGAFLSYVRPLPVPSAFLVGPDGDLVAMYKGPVGVERVLADVARIDGPLEERRDVAALFPGRWARQWHQFDTGTVTLTGYLRAVWDEPAARFTAPLLLAGLMLMVVFRICRRGTRKTQA